MNAGLGMGVCILDGLSGGTDVQVITRTGSTADPLGEPGNM